VGPEVGLPGSAASAIAGWWNLSLELSAGAPGLRILQVLLDAEGRPLAGSDHVLFLRPSAAEGGRAWMIQENIGGRFEPDGSFQGTCWRVEGPDATDEDPPPWAAAPRPPTAGEAVALRALLDELVRRHSGR
jgi:hypothetical protein